ncbi:MULTISPECIES: hypothetical protein, partial [unclassified Streptomyces]|uniref:hypothetical protein n=1 Tax=unclassified Streptomyces TaxID=2593676 RepID=UPI00081E6EAD
MNTLSYGGGAMPGRRPYRRLSPLTLLLTVAALCMSLVALPQQEAAAGTAVEGGVTVGGAAAAAPPTGWTTVINKTSG